MTLFVMHHRRVNNRLWKQQTYIHHKDALMISTVRVIPKIKIVHPPNAHFLDYAC